MHDCSNTFYNSDGLASWISSSSLKRAQKNNYCVNGSNDMMVKLTFKLILIHTFVISIYWIQKNNEPTAVD